MTTERHTAQDGDYLEPDGWPMGENITADTDTYTDSGWPGCEFRIPAGNGTLSLGINIKTTGKPHFVPGYHNAKYRSRCRIEFVGDCEESTFTGGWIYHSNFNV